MYAPLQSYTEPVATTEPAAEPVETAPAQIGPSYLGPGGGDAATAVEAFGHFADPGIATASAAPAPADFGARPTEPGQDHFFVDQLDYENGLHGFDIGGSLAGSAGEISDIGTRLGLNPFGLEPFDNLLSGRATVGTWDEDGEDHIGARANLGFLPKEDGLDLSNIPLVGSAAQWLFGPEATGELEMISGAAELSFGEKGVAAGATATLLGAGVTMGEFHADDTTEDQWRFGLSASAGGGVRLHGGDEDGDGFQELGFGFDSGPLSFDLRSEDLARSVLGLGGLTEGLLPEGNLTQAGLGMLDDAGAAAGSWLEDWATPDDQGLEPRAPEAE